MAKCCVKVGYGIDTEVRPGVWKKEKVEQTHFGDTLRLVSQARETDGVNDDLKLDVQFSLMIHPMLVEHASDIRYVEYLGARWKVTRVELVEHRLILTVGGVWNGD